MTSLDVGVIGNSRIASLIDRRGAHVWTCLPQLDADPVFCRLLRDENENDAPGIFAVELIDFQSSEQKYLTNTAILVTTLHDKNGGSIRLTDVAPRYDYLGRMFTPMMLLRRIEPISGTPRIRIRLRPACQYGAASCDTTVGSNHIRYLCHDTTIRLTTDASVTQVIDESVFCLLYTSPSPRDA